MPGFLTSVMGNPRSGLFEFAVYADKKSGSNSALRSAGHDAGSTAAFSEGNILQAISRTRLSRPDTGTAAASIGTSESKFAREGALIFNDSQHILYASNSLRDVLGIPDTLALVGASFAAVMSSAFVSGQTGLETLVRWLASIHNPSALAPSFETLLVTEGQRRTRLSISEIGEGCWLSSFKDELANDAIVQREHASALRDHLTGIGSRLFFEQKLEDALAKLASGDEDSASLLFVDLDRFKAVNDTLGHAVGDALLRLVSDRLTQSLREGDILARLGGDEFAILLAGSITREASAALAARIIDLIQRPYLVDGHVINVGASIGLAVAPENGQTRVELLSSADLALYQSKAAGRGVYHFFETSMLERAQNRRALELDLRKALLLRQFELHYQPQIDVETEGVIGLEGLLRWRHPVRGLLLPGDFLPLAEELGLAVPIGDWVLKTACREAVRWPSSVTIAVNVSPLQFEMGKFAQTVARALTTAGLSGDRLEVEVTENILLRDGHAVLATLNDLRALGVRVAMDSFGTGVASLSQLVNFPFDKIKIDRSLIALQQVDSRNRAIVRAISALGHSLGISTLAEGVETAEHLAHVRAEGCHSVQGFYYSKAVPSGELAATFPQLFPAATHPLLPSKGAA